jgi:hypothetical protein
MVPREWVSDKMTHIMKVVLISTFLCASPKSYAEETKYWQTFQYIYNDCKTPATFCLGYIRGVSETIDAKAYVFAMFDALLAETSKDKINLHANFYMNALCIPEHTTLGAMAQVVVNYGQQHPERWSEDALSVVFDALHEKWPCKR